MTDEEIRVYAYCRTVVPSYVPLSFKSHWVSPRGGVMVDLGLHEPILISIEELVDAKLVDATFPQTWQAMAALASKISQDFIEATEGLRRSARTASSSFAKLGDTLREGFSEAAEVLSR